MTLPDRDVMPPPTSPTSFDKSGTLPSAHLSHPAPTPTSRASRAQSEKLDTNSQTFLRRKCKGYQKPISVGLVAQDGDTERGRYKWQQIGLLGDDISKADNAVLLCGTCHTEFDKTTDPGYGFSLRP
ncbi:uncharacterized protein N7473_012032 [Penicillium subrubescens]|uniref:HNH domain-containing protein n=1 Tax=Penicillium subrubescens TaxID=1316194 RepID=A0A1Q5UJJ3_9EURO|nr:uncharacterized protein N7473_012032 [Penicillium subrubescens]KAJ5880979.1 hypothetical protein N7473_012032 [Penicillium subrubescens]OKP12640.1 hypothetical protein PENSUB_1733 [Penicillium subrubescens]